ncbi:MAG: sterol desaturase family protein, partial [Myxococcota bacterium]
MNTEQLVAIASLPVLLGAQLAEHLVARALGRRGYSWRQTFNNLGASLVSRAVLGAVGLVPLLGYRALRDLAGLWDGWSTRDPVHWVVVFLLTDLALYLRHRLAHRVAALWVVHAVHHQSRDYNLSVATRFSWFQDAVLVTLPLALLGVPYPMALGCWLVGNVFQYFQHTELVGRLGALDRWLVTPSNHRAHHGSNPAYLDCNYGAVLLVWDRLFGTWVPETEPVTFGTTTGLPTYDATDNNLEPLRGLWRKLAHHRSAWDKLRIVFAPPAWTPDRGELPPVVVTDPEPQRINVVSPGRRVFAAATLAIAAALTAVGTGPAAAGAVVALVAVGGVTLDGRRVEPPVPGLRGRIAAALATLAGPDARGPLFRLARVTAGA